MESILVKRSARNSLARYGVAAAAPVCAFLLRLPFTSILGDKVPYITFFLATGVSASFGGFGPGLVTTALGAALAMWWIVPPVGSVRFTDLGDTLGFVLFLGISSFISYLAGELLASRRYENAARLLFQQTLVSIGDALISVDGEKRVQLMNPVAERLTGWTEAEAKGRLVSEVFKIVQEGTDTPVEIPIEQILRTGRIVDLAGHTELASKTGQRICIDDSGAPILDEAGRVAGAVLVFRDVTDKRRVERELIESERRARTILSSVSDAFILLDQEWRYAQVNSGAEKIMGAPADTFLGRNHWDVYPATVGSPLERIYRKAMADRVPINFENYYEPWGRWYEIRAYPSTEGLAVYFHDITERKSSAATLLRLNEDLTQFTYAATHDVREPLRMITIYAQMLQRKLGDSLGAEANEYIKHVVSGAQSIARLMDGVLSFTRLGESRDAGPVPVNAEAALEEALDNLQIAISESKAKITHDPMPVVLGDSTHICQLFQNLVANALKYHDPGTPPSAHLSVRRDGGEWIFAVHDDGIGIAPEHQEKIFIPFKRLHSSEIAGAGIGLATCKRIVERYNGRIWVESKPGQGSTFYFSLKAAEAGHVESN